MTRARVAGAVAGLVLLALPGSPRTGSTPSIGAPEPGKAVRTQADGAALLLDERDVAGADGSWNERTLARRADAYLERTIAEQSIPGIAAAIAVDGRVVWEGAAGVADVERGTVVTSDTAFRIASISKVLTATAILRLAEEGRIDLDAPVQTYLPEYPAPRRGTMTIAQLLTHTSGIRHSKGDESRRSMTRFESMRDACSFFEKRKLAFAPGTKHLYSSYGYTVLGAILESATGGSFESYMAEKVWKPAGMVHAGLDRRPADPARVAGLYRTERGEIVPDVANDLSLIYPGGGMVASAGDLVRFVNALQGGELLSPESLERMWRRPVYDGKVLAERGGMGWNVWDHETHGRILTRVGGQSGASGLLVSYVDRGVTVALLANMARLDPIWELTNDLVGMALSVRDEQVQGSAAP